MTELEPPEAVVEAVREAQMADHVAGLENLTELLPRGDVAEECGAHGAYLPSGFV